MLGKIAVARVIRNRMRLRYSSDGTVPGTVLFPYQFSGWNTRDANRVYAAKIDTDSRDVVECRQAWEASATEDAGVKGAVLYFTPTPWVHSAILGASGEEGGGHRGT